MSQLIISVSGLRGEIGKTLDADVVRKYISAYTTYLDENHFPGPLVVGYDGRKSGEAIGQAVGQACASAGRLVLWAGVTATPTLGILVREMNAAAGVQITASHNPHPWNGLKLFSAEGRIISRTPGERVKTLYDANVVPSVPESSDADTRVTKITDTISAHLKKILSLVDAQQIRKCRFRVMLDTNHGAGSILSRRLLDELGVDVIFASENEMPDGEFQHTPEPTRENLVDTCRKVRENGVDLGFAQDPDADRLAIIDTKGEYLGEEYTLALCVKHILSRGRGRGAVVTNCATSMMTRDIALEYAAPFFLTPVGEANVVDKIFETHAIFGGEGNGGPIAPDVGLVRDSFVGMALVLDRMAKTGKTVRALAEELPHYEIVKTKFDATPEALPEIFGRFLKKYPDAEASREDGLRLTWPDRWVLIRGSNTEPVARIIAEAKTRAIAESLCEI